MKNKFTWIPFYKELSDWLLGKQNSQPELISTLKEIGITGFRDGTERGKEITLQEIDPFTFLLCIAWRRLRLHRLNQSFHDRPRVCIS